MNLIFQNVNIFVFDIHTTVNPLISSALMKDTLRFLLEAKLYRDQYDMRKVLETDHFTIRPLAPRIRARHHFWKAYTSIRHGRKPDFWKLQVPFVCEPKHLAARMSSASKHESFGVHVRPVIFINSVGWSTNIEMTLIGRITPETWRDFVGQLKTDARVFLLNDEPKGLSETFRFFAERLRRDLYSESAELVDRLRVPRHLVTSVSELDGTPLGPYRYGPLDDRRIATMADVDRAMLHSVLLGYPVEVDDLASRERERKFLLTRFRGSDFALTYFEGGTLLFLQDRASTRGVRRSLYCFASNVRCCTIMLLLLQHFQKDSAVFAKENTKVASLRKAVETTVEELPKLYVNAFCRKWSHNVQ